MLIFSAPSGSGKTSIVRYLLDQDLNLEFSISACSREKRVNETHGRDYYFISNEEFQKRIDNNEFIEWEEVYKDHFYGTLRSEVERIWKKGKHVIFDIDVLGGLNIKRQFGDDALAVFVKAPAINDLKDRLIARGTESSEKIQKRMDRVEYELGFIDQFDVIIVNDILDKAREEALILVRNFIKKD